jgi:hypothetical protein
MLRRLGRGVVRAPYGSPLSPPRSAGRRERVEDDWLNFRATPSGGWGAARGVPERPATA